MPSFFLVLRAHRHVFIVEQNRDAQLRALLALETGVARDAMIPILDYGGLPLTSARVVNGVMAHLAPSLPSSPSSPHGARLTEAAV